MSCGALEQPIETTTDSFLGGRVALVQPKRGHRAGLDAALIQAAVPADAKGRAAEFGTGAGSAAFALASRAPGLSVTGIENDPAVAALARRGLALAANAAFRDRVRIVEADAGAARPIREAAGLADGAFAWVLMNPPFDDPGKVSRSPHAGKRTAYLAGPDLLEAWIAAASGLLAPGGHVALIHRPAALGAILAALSGRFGDVQILPVHPRAGEPAGRVLVRGTRGRKGPLRILPALILHEPTGADETGWTAAARAILEGATHVTWL